MNPLVSTIFNTQIWPALSETNTSISTPGCMDYITYIVNC